MKFGNRSNRSDVKSLTIFEDDIPSPMIPLDLFLIFLFLVVVVVVRGLSVN